MVWSADTLLHDPQHEVWVGVPTLGTEVATRVDVIRAALIERPLIDAVHHDRALLARISRRPSRP